MTDGEALVRAVIENPDDDTPRLVYADWLDENGQADRAEFIRLQVEAAQLPEGDGHQLEVRADKLLVPHKDEWVGPLRDLVFWHRFIRGFVERVNVEARTFLDRPDELFRLAPVRDAFIRLDRDRDEVGGVAGSPHLARLRVLRVGCVDGAGVEALARSPRLGNLKALHLGGNQLSDAGLRALAESTSLPRLVTLDVTDNGVGAAGLRALAESPLVARVGELVLRHNPFGPDGVRALAGSARLGDGRLASLDLTACRLGDAGAACLASAPWARSLRRLSLGDNDLGEEGFEALVSSPFLSALEYLDLRWNQLTDDDRFALRGRFGAAVEF